MCVLLFHGASPVVTARLYEESVRSPQSLLVRCQVVFRSRVDGCSKNTDTYRKDLCQRFI